MKHSIEYDRYIKSDLWKAKREERLNYDNNACVLCGRKNGVLKDGRPILQVHHLNYLYKPFGTEPLSSIISVCPRCHLFCHKLKDLYRIEREEREKANRNQ